MEIPAGLFGHMLEITGRCVYDGVWVGEDSPIPNDDGLRLDTIEAYRQLKVSNMRLGGAAGEYYHWQEGIGPRDQRRRSRIYFGEDMTRTISVPTSSFASARPSVRNRSFRSTWPPEAGGKRLIGWSTVTRRHRPNWPGYGLQNGHPEPYGVEYWQIGMRI